MWLGILVNCTFIRTYKCTKCIPAVTTRLYMAKISKCLLQSTDETKIHTIESVPACHDNVSK